MENYSFFGIFVNYLTLCAFSSVLLSLPEWTLWAFCLALSSSFSLPAFCVFERRHLTEHQQNIANFNAYSGAGSLHSFQKQQQPHSLWKKATDALTFFRHHSLCSRLFAKMHKKLSYRQAVRQEEDKRTMPLLLLLLPLSSKSNLYKQSTASWLAGRHATLKATNKMKHFSTQLEHTFDTLFLEKYNPN